MEGIRSWRREAKKKNGNRINITHPPHKHTGGPECGLTFALTFDLAILFAQFVFIVVVVLFGRIYATRRCHREWTAATSYMHLQLIPCHRIGKREFFVSQCDAALCTHNYCKENKTEGIQCECMTRVTHTRKYKWKQRSNSTGKKKATWSMAFGAEESRSR